MSIICQWKYSTYKYSHGRFGNPKGHRISSYAVFWPLTCQILCNLAHGCCIKQRDRHLCIFNPFTYALQWLLTNIVRWINNPITFGWYIYGYATYWHHARNRRHHNNTGCPWCFRKRMFQVGTCEKLTWNWQPWETQVFSREIYSIQSTHICPNVVYLERHRPILILSISMIT